jgi:hypothetical protein
MSLPQDDLPPPTILNKQSDFVMVTYWWGDHAKNFNTQRPCLDPPEVTMETPLTQKPISHLEVIKRWKQSCIDQQCNYLILKLDPERRKEYQKRINMKPSFILKALKSCYPRSVVYLDSDMVVRKYPQIFDMKGVDYMSFGWNSDIRVAWTPSKSQGCQIDPYVFETSGPVQYFSPSLHALNLLKRWAEECKKHPLLADDRLLSLVFNTETFLLGMTIIQLPIEYCWMTVYDHAELPPHIKNLVGDIFLEHADCMTSESMAQQLSSGISGSMANTSRIPKSHYRMIGSHRMCMRHKSPMPFYEYIFFDDSHTASQTLRHSLKANTKLGALELIPYSQKYGDAKNLIAKDNLEMAHELKQEKLPTKDRFMLTEEMWNLVMMDTSDAKSLIKFNNIGKTCMIRHSRNNLMAKILSCLQEGIGVIVVDKNHTKASIRRMLNMLDYSPDLACKNINTNSKVLYKKEFYLKMDYDSHPIYFGPNSKVLQHLVTMSKNLVDFNNNFNSSYIFISRMRCMW